MTSMALYSVRMFYYTDLRHEAKVKASGSLQALAVALHELPKYGVPEAEWVTDKGFRVEILLDEQ